MPKRKIVTTQAELNTLPEEMRADILELSDPCRFGDVTYVTISVPENQ